MALVEMSVNVDEQRQHDAARHCDFWRVAEVDGACRRDLRDATLVNENVDDRETVKVERRDGLGQRCGRARAPASARSAWRWGR